MDVPKGLAPNNKDEKSLKHLLRDPEVSQKPMDGTELYVVGPIKSLMRFEDTTLSRMLKNYGEVIDPREIEELKGV